MREVTRRFGNLVVLDHVSFSVAAGQIAVIAGPNGSGKTTLLRCVVGADRPDEGEILIEGRRSDETHPAQRAAVAAALDDIDFFPDLSVVEHLELMAYAHGAEAGIVAEVVAELGLDRVRDQLPGALSSGQRRRLALASCQHYEQGHYAVHREIAARDLDFVLFVGDYIYETSHPDHMVRAHEGPTPTRLDTYRRRHATYKLDPHLRAAHAAHPWVLTWDDHEVENDYAGEHSWFDLDTASFLRRRAAAYKAYFEHMPVSPAMAPQGPAMRIHDRYTWGQLAELWTLDTRQYRSIPACSPHPRLSGGRLLHRCAELVDDRRSLLGAEQERWLAAGLHRSTRAWKLLAQSTQISPWGVDTPVGRSVYSDSWDGYPRARERLLAGIAEAGVRDVVTLGGDVHRHVAAQLRLRPNDPRSPVVASEFVTTSVTSRGLPESVMGVIRYANPDLVHARSDERGYALVEFTPASARCEFRATAHPVAQDARLHTQAAYAVERGRAGVQRDR